MYYDNNSLSEKSKNLEKINAVSKVELQDYKLICKVFVNKQSDDMLNKQRDSYSLNCVENALEIIKTKDRNTRCKR